MHLWIKLPHEYAAPLIWISHQNSFKEVLWIRPGVHVHDHGPCLSRCLHVLMRHLPAWCGNRRMFETGFFLEIRHTAILCSTERKWKPQKQHWWDFATVVTKLNPEAEEYKSFMLPEFESENLRAVCDIYLALWILIIFLLLLFKYLFLWNGSGAYANFLHFKIFISKWQLNCMDWYHPIGGFLSKLRASSINWCHSSGMPMLYLRTFFSIFSTGFPGSW